MAQNEIFATLDSLSSMQKHVAIQKRENIVKTKGVLPQEIIITKLVNAVENIYGPLKVGSTEKVKNLGKI